LQVDGVDVTQKNVVEEPVLVAWHFVLFGWAFIGYNVPNRPSQAIGQLIYSTIQVVTASF
jgi:hypothetical protein